jgi:hypothetical protein
MKVVTRRHTGRRLISELVVTTAAAIGPEIVELHLLGTTFRYRRYVAGSSRGRREGRAARAGNRLDCGGPRGHSLVAPSRAW